MSTKIRTERVRANGLDFHVNTCGEGDRLALCLHGFPEIGYSWRHQLPLLASLGYRAWAPDLRGYGESDKPKGVKNYAVERLVEDAAALIDASGAKETIVLAHDWGVMIALQLASHQVRPLERIVIFNGATMGAWQRPGRIKLSDLKRSSYALFFQLPFLPGVGHWVQQEAGDEVNEMLTAWLAGKPVPGSETVSSGYAGE
jgi:pimeloyl-ACP methyl ester carboxylesterase